MRSAHFLHPCVLLLCILAACTVADSSYKITGTLIGSKTTTIAPSYDYTNNAACQSQSGTTSWPYLNFTLTNVTVGEFYQLQVFLDTELYYGHTVSLYTAPFDVANPCANLLIGGANEPGFGTAHSPQVHLFFNATVPTIYVGLVSKQARINGGQQAFAFHMETLTAVFDTSTAENYWYYPYSFSSDPYICRADEGTPSAVHPYITYTFTPNTTGYFDMLVYNTLDNDINSVARGMLVVSDNASQPLPDSYQPVYNSSTPLNICKFNQTGYSLNREQRPLTTGTNYPSFELNSDFTGRTNMMMWRSFFAEAVGLKLTESNPIEFGGATYLRPYGGTCTGSGYPFVVTKFVATDPIHMVSLLYTSNGMDTYFDVFRGDNTLSVTPNGCPTAASGITRLNYGMGWQSYALFAVIGETYSVVAYPSSGSSGLAGVFASVKIAGGALTVGTLPASPTSPSSAPKAGSTPSNPIYNYDPDYYGPDYEPSDDSFSGAALSVGAIVGIVVGVFALIIVISVVCWCYRAGRFFFAAAVVSAATSSPPASPAVVIVASNQGQAYPMQQYAQPQYAQPGYGQPYPPQGQPANYYT